MTPLRRSAAIVVQARVGSTRLPNKVLADFGGTTLLAYQLRRLARCEPALPIWVATTTQEADEATASSARHEHVHVHRGPVDDVLTRFVQCIDSMDDEPELVVRLAADRPFVCPLVICEMLALYDEYGAPDYLANNRPRSYPDGLDVEILRVDALRAAGHESEDAYEREHVTPFVYRRPERFRLANHPCPYGNFSPLRVTLDTQEDLDALRDVARKLDAAVAEHDHRDLLNLAALEPAIFPSGPAREVLSYP